MRHSNKEHSDLHKDCNTTVLFMGGCVGACRDFGFGEVLLAEWLSPVVCEFGKKKLYLTLKY